MFSKPSEFAGGSYFKPKEHTSDLALLIEPTHIDKNVESDYNGQKRTRDEVTANITVFANTSELEAGKPGKIMKNTKIVHGMLTSTVERIIGGAMVATVTMTATRNGQGYVFRDVDAATEAKVGAYFQARDAEIAANLADAPGFD